MSKTEKKLYDLYEEFRQGLKWKEGTTEDEIGRALLTLQQFLKFMIDNEWKSGVTSRRDQFAMSALQGILADPEVLPDLDQEYPDFADELAESAFIFADAMIKRSEQ